MSAMFLKRALTWSIPVFLIGLAIQYYGTGKLTGRVVTINLVIYLLAGVLFEALSGWQKRAFGQSTFARTASAGFWAIAAIGLFVFFYHMS